MWHKNWKELYNTTTSVEIRECCGVLQMKTQQKATYNIRKVQKTPQTSLNIVLVVVMYPQITKIENFGVRNWQNKAIKYNIKFLWKSKIPQYMKKCKFLGTFHIKNKKNKSQNNWITEKSTPKKQEFNMSGYIREKLQAKMVTKRLNNKKTYPEKRRKWYVGVH